MPRALHVNFPASRRALAALAVVVVQQPSATARRTRPLVDKDIHVTRLHRWDHSGYDSMIEAEARWLRGGDGDGGSLEQLSAGTGAATNASLSEASARAEQLKRPYVTMSRQQVQALRQHHDEHLPSLVELDDGMGAGPADTAGTVKAKAAASVSPRRHHDLRGSATVGTGARLHGAITATALTNIGSQYVGPVGVGTSVSPSGCHFSRSTREATVARDAFATMALVEEEGRKTCQVKNQADLWVVYDTGSTNIWIASDLCTEGACRNLDRHRYDHTASATYSSADSLAQLSITFGTGKIQGTQGVDDFHIGPFTVARQTFGMIAKQTGRVFDVLPFEGIVGLAWPTLSARGSAAIFDNIIDQGVLMKNQFAFYFHKHDPSANAIFWGGVDPAFHTGPMEYLPVVDPYYWSLKLKSFKIGQHVVLGEKDARPLLQRGSARKVPGDKTPEGPFAIVDTGTTYFSAESGKFEEVLSHLPRVDCDDMNDESHPPITLSMLGTSGDDIDFVLTRDQYMVSTELPGEPLECHPAFMKVDLPAQHGPAIILGEVFLRSYLAVFDRGSGGLDEGRVGLAQSQQENVATDQLRRLTKSQPSFVRPPKENVS